MKYWFIIIFLLGFNFTISAQKDSLTIGDAYADDHLYLSVSYAQLISQPTTITRSGFSYSFSTGFIKDIILNKRGNFSLGLGVGYGYQNITHKLRVEETNNNTTFAVASGVIDNRFKTHDLEFPFEVRWRTSTAKKYDFWRIYTGIKFLYNLSNSFNFVENSNQFTYKNVNSYRKFQYGLTFSAGYDAFNVYFFYGLTPIFNNATLNGETINTKILKFGAIFYIL